MREIESAIPQEFAKRYGPHFSFDELKCKCGGRFCDPLKGVWWKTAEFESFMKVAMLLRRELKFPFVVTSGYRCPDYNNEISSTGFDGPHTKGAMDIKVSFERAYALNQMASDFSLGLGIAQHGNVSSRFYHIDNLGARIWTYP